jgi:hypothetical protein
MQCACAVLYSHLWPVWHHCEILLEYPVRSSINVLFDTRFSKKVTTAHSCVHSMFCGPCMVIYLHNKDHQDAPFTFSFTPINNLYMVYAFFWVIQRNTLFHLHRRVDGTDSVFRKLFNLQTPVNHPEESIRHSEHGESLKSRTSTCFEQLYCSSSGGTILHIQQLVYVMRLRCLAARYIPLRSC